jgi:predicted RNA-binding protein with PUA-like domain
MNHWLLKTEPATYAWADLVRAGRARWDGVKNPAALGHLRAMRPGDQAFVYHTGGEKAVVGIARVLTGAYPDPSRDDPRFAVIDLEPVRALESPVTLAAIKGDPRSAGCALVRVPRLAVMPVDQEQWHRIIAMSRRP